MICTVRFPVSVSKKSVTQTAGQLEGQYDPIFPFAFRLFLLGLVDCWYLFGWLVGCFCLSYSVFVLSCFGLFFFILFSWVFFLPSSFTMFCFPTVGLK